MMTQEEKDTVKVAAVAMAENLVAEFLAEVEGTWRDHPKESAYPDKAALLRAYDRVDGALVLALHLSDPDGCPSPWRHASTILGRADIDWAVWVAFREVISEAGRWNYATRQTIRWWALNVRPREYRDHIRMVRQHVPGLPDMAEVRRQSEGWTP